MINKEMNMSSTGKKISSPSDKKPNEVGGVYFSSSVKIFDPNTKEILMHKRGDD